MSDTRRDFLNATADAGDKALAHPLVQLVIKEQLGNFGAKDNGLVSYGLHKIAAYAAQVARCQALGIDPDVLRATRREVWEHQLDLMANALAADKEVIVVHPD